MLPKWKVRKIEKLLAETNTSQRVIARIVGVSRGTVGAIARGRRPDYEALRRTKEEKEQEMFHGPPQRCPTCGAFVYMPCHACRIRESRETSHKPRGIHLQHHPDEICKLDLNETHRARYEMIRATRREGTRWRPGLVAALLAESESCDTVETSETP